MGTKVVTSRIWRHRDRVVRMVVGTEAEMGVAVSKVMVIIITIMDTIIIRDTEVESLVGRGIKQFILRGASQV